MIESIKFKESLYRQDITQNELYFRTNKIRQIFTGFIPVLIVVNKYVQEHQTSIPSSFFFFASLHMAS